MRQINFLAGPASLPVSVLNQLKDSILEYESTGVGICELGHRSNYFLEIIEEAKGLIIEILGLPKNYEVLFMTGGGTAQFSSVPLNFMQEDKAGGYLISGHWAKAAFEEAGRFCPVVSLGSTEDIEYRSLPTLTKIPDNLSYFHFTSNNTIYGTQYMEVPIIKGIPVICDMSSDFLSRKIDVTQYSLIYAAAQKLLGIAGVTVVVINKDSLPNVGTIIPKSLDYQVQLESNSIHNTPPVVAIYSVLLMLRWLKSEGGLDALEARNIAKAKILYDFLDQSNFYVPRVAINNKKDRSMMNVTFNLKDSTKEPMLFQELKNNGIIGTEGYRALGGCRISLYNPIELSAVEKLVDVLKLFESNIT